MPDHAPPPDASDLRGRVRFYLSDYRTPLGRSINFGLLVLNAVFIGLYVAETYPVSPAVRALLWGAEVTITLVFLAEYLLRLYSARSTVQEFFDPYTMVDLLSILPTLVVLVLPGATVVALDIGFLRAVRIIRVLRFFRFTRDEQFFFGSVSAGALRATRLLLTVLSLFFVSAALFYNFEHPVNPDVSTFGDAFYYTVVTLSTVGFGDIAPVTWMGRWVTVLSILVAIILIPWQAGKIIRAWQSAETVDVTCPNCGLTGHDPDASHCKACGHVIYQPHDPRR